MKACLLILCLVSVPLFADKKRDVQVEVLASSIHEGKSGVYAAPIGASVIAVPITPHWIEISAHIEGHSVTLTCNAGDRDCAQLKPGKTYNGQVKGDTLKVIGNNWDGSKTKTAKYKIH